MGPFIEKARIPLRAHPKGREYAEVREPQRAPRGDFDLVDGKHDRLREYGLSGQMEVHLGDRAVRVKRGVEHIKMTKVPAAEWAAEAGLEVGEVLGG